MISKDFSPGDLVWAKMKGYPPWPAKIIEPPAEVKTPSKQKKSQHYVFFFGSENYAWILDENIFHHSDKMIPTNMKKKPAQFQTAIDMILNQFKSQPKKEKPVVTDNSNEENLVSENAQFKPSLVNNTHKKVKDNSAASKSFEKMMKATKREEKMKKKISGSISNKVLSPIKDKNIDNEENSKLPKKIKKRPSDSESTDNEMSATYTKDKKNDEYSSLILRKDPPKTKKRKKRPSGSESSENEGLRHPKEIKTDDDEYSDLLASVPPNAGYAALPICDESFLGEQEEFPPNLNLRYIERPPTPSLNVETVCEILKARHIHPTGKTIGFLGLGLIGRGVVKNLLNSGHEVYVWNRTPQKCECFIKAGAKRCLTPEDVVASCEIIFCCVSDPDAARSLVFGNCGVLQGMERHGRDCVKGYVEMTSVDPETSQEIAEAISLKGGKYLEAHVNGSRRQAEDGTLFILAAGDQSLFSDCASCFHAMGKHAYFISCVVGSGSKMNLILSALNGVICAALAECMVLVERLGLSLEDFIEILEITPLKCPLVMEKARAILSKDFSTNTALKHVQKDLCLAMQLGESCSQPTPVAAAANEIYKHAKQLRYADHDVCAVYQGIKY